MDSFIFGVILTCPSSELVALEQSYLDLLFNNFPKALIYNFCAVAYSVLGYIHTPEVKAAIIGNTHRVGKTHTAETKAAISKILLGNTNSLGNASKSRGPIFVYLHDTPGKLVGEYTSIMEACPWKYLTLLCGAT